MSRGRAPSNRAWESWPSLPFDLSNEPPAPCTNLGGRCCCQPAAHPPTALLAGPTPQLPCRVGYKKAKKGGRNRRSKWGAVAAVRQVQHASAGDASGGCAHPAPSTAAVRAARKRLRSSAGLFFLCPQCARCLRWNEPRCRACILTAALRTCTAVAAAGWRARRGWRGGVAWGGMQLCTSRCRQLGSSRQRTAPAGRQ